METWEQIVVGIFCVVLVILLFPNLRSMIERSKQAEKDWQGLLVPLVFVIGLIVFVIFLLRS